MDDASKDLLKRLEQQQREMLDHLKRIEQYVQHIQPMTVDVQEVHREIASLKSGLSTPIAPATMPQQPPQV